MEKAKKYSYIDSLRGYAVLMVLATHVYAFINDKDKTMLMENFLIQCRMGVMLFFLVSALTLFLSLGQKIDREKHPIANFFIRRFFRIVPLFYLIVAGNLFFGKYSLVNIIGTVTFTNGFMPNTMMVQIVAGGWSLAVEMVFYLLLPLIFKYVKSFKTAFVLFVVSLVVSIAAKYLVMRCLVGTYPEPVLIEYVYYWLPAQLPVFALGIMLYFALFKSDFAAVMQLSDFKTYLGYFLIFAGIYFFIVMSFSAKLFITENIAFSFALMLFVLGMAIHPSTVFNNRYTQFLGKISYSFYLLHFIIIVIAKRCILPMIMLKGNVLFVVSTVGILIVTAGVSYISYCVIEQPFQKIGASLITKKEQSDNRSY